MSIDALLTFLLTQGPHFLAKLITTVLLVLHFLFSLLLIRQTKMMLRVVEARISPVIYGIVFLHALFSLFVVGFVLLGT